MELILESFLKCMADKKTIKDTNFTPTNHERVYLTPLTFNLVYPVLCLYPQS